MFLIKKKQKKSKFHKETYRLQSPDTQSKPFVMDIQHRNSFFIRS
jgi:hypothetical protein